MCKSTDVHPTENFNYTSDQIPTKKFRMLVVQKNLTKLSKELGYLQRGDAFLVFCLFVSVCVCTLLQRGDAFLFFCPLHPQRRICYQNMRQFCVWAD
jgi:hypothetical protein